MMASGRFTVVLWLLVVVSAFAVIISSHKARQSFIAWQALLEDAQAFDVEWGQLLIQKNSSASYVRLEDIATSKLKMSAPGSDKIIVVRGEEQ